jgi:hypothetical protein
MTGRMPHPEGYGPAELTAREAARHDLRITRAMTLADLAREYAIFNHGTFFTHGRLDVDPVADFVVKHPDADCMAMPATMPAPVFRGIATPGRQPGLVCDWDRTLVFVPLPYWPALSEHLRLCGWVDRRRKFYARAVPQRIAIVDVLALAHMRVLPIHVPTVEVVAYGVDGTHTHVQFRPDVRRPDTVPSLVYLPLVDETARIGQALLAGVSRPFQFVEPEDPFAGVKGVVPPTT